MIIVAADHGGFELKEQIKEWLATAYGHVVVDLTPERVAGDDYPVLTQRIAQEAKVAGEPVRIIAFCRSGVGMALGMNRFRFLRAVQGTSVNIAQQSRTDEDANAISIGADFQSLAQTKKIIQSFLETSFKPLDRYQRRVKELSSYGQT
jgi:ribose 5-phosphate isomerase B